MKTELRSALLHLFGAYVACLPPQGERKELEERLFPHALGQEPKTAIEMTNQLSMLHREYDSRSRLYFGGDEGTGYSMLASIMIENVGIHDLELRIIQAGDKFRLVTLGISPPSHKLVKPDPVYRIGLKPQEENRRARWFMELDGHVDDFAGQLSTVTNYLLETSVLDIDSHAVINKLREAVLQPLATNAL